MARLIPKIDVQEIALKPERDVASALVQQLGNDCIVYHSYPWLKADRNDRGSKAVLREGEADFVVIVPTRGMLILEVKGGTIEYDPQDRGWYRRLDHGQRKEIKDPFAQARSNAHVLAKQIQEKEFAAREGPPFPFGYAVVFPDCEYHGPTPPGAEPVIVLSAKDVAHLDSRIPKILEAWSRTEKPRQLDRSDLESIQRAISPAFQLLPVLFRQVEEQEEKLFRLTEEQTRLLDFLGDHERAAIEGVAGSGKTLLARAQAQRFADSGKKTLLICYNKALAQWIGDTLPESYAEQIKVRHFHGLCMDWCKAAGIKLIPPAENQDTFWRDEAPELLMKAIETVSDRFDAVVVDEGQDFYPDWWFPLEEINARGDQGALYVFYDPAQNLFVTEKLSLPNLGKPFVLPTNCRNTRRIAVACGDVIGCQLRTHPSAPEGAEVRHISAPSKDEQIKQVGALLEEWVQRGRLTPSQVAILCPTQVNRSSVSDIKAKSKGLITEDLAAWRANKGVLFSTIRAFKGLEADAVILIDIIEPDRVPYFTRADFYVACSRAKHLLVVLKRS